MKKLEIDKLEDYFKPRETRFHASPWSPSSVQAPSPTHGHRFQTGPPIVGERRPAIRKRPAPPDPSCNKPSSLTPTFRPRYNAGWIASSKQAAQGQAEAAKWLH